MPPVQQWIAVFALYFACYIVSNRLHLQGQPGSGADMSDGPML